MYPIKLKAEGYWAKLYIFFCGELANPKYYYSNLCCFFSVAKALGESCSATSDCADSNAECVSVCTCLAGYTEHSSACVGKCCTFQLVLIRPNQQTLIIYITFI